MQLIQSLWNSPTNFLESLLLTYRKDGNGAAIYQIQNLSRSGLEKDKYQNDTEDANFKKNGTDSIVYFFCYLIQKQTNKQTEVDNKDTDVQGN